MRLKKSQGQIEAIGNMASTLKPDAKKSVQANVKAIYGHLDNAIAKIRASSKISKANIDAINADLIKEINKAVADVKVKLEKQKSAEEQERLRKIQEVRNFLFLTFSACFYIPIIFSNLNSNCSNSSYLRNLQEQVKKAFCYQKLF